MNLEAGRGVGSGWQTVGTEEIEMSYLAVGGGTRDRNGYGPQVRFRYLLRRNYRISVTLTLIRFWIALRGFRWPIGERRDCRQSVVLNAPEQVQKPTTFPRSD